MNEIKYKYKRGTKKEHPTTVISFKGKAVGYLMPLYNKPEFHCMEKGNHNRWYVNINTDEYFLIEKAESKKSIMTKVENYFKTIH